MPQRFGAVVHPDGLRSFFFSGEEDELESNDRLVAAGDESRALVSLPVGEKGCQHKGAALKFRPIDLAEPTLHHILDFIADGLAGDRQSFSSPHPFLVSGTLNLVA